MHHPHAKLIKKLGGTTALGRLFGFTPQRVDRWRRIGIAIRFWPRIAKLCKERRIRVPRDIAEFLK